MNVNEVARSHGKGNPDIVVNFNSATELVGKTSDRFYKERQKEVGFDKFNRFIGEYLPTWMHVKDRIDKSSPQAIEMLEECRAEIKDKINLPELKSRKRKRHLSSEDGELDVERYVSGEDRMFEDIKRETRTGSQEVTIIIDVATNFKVNPKSIFWKGAAGLVIAEILEERGYTTEIWGCSTTTNSCNSLRGRRLCIGAPLKTYRDTFDIASMVNVLAGWFFRAITICTIGDLCDMLFDEKPSVGYGSAVPANHDMLTTLTGDEDAFYVAGIESLEGAMAVVMTTIDSIRKAHEAHDWDSPFKD